MLDGAKRYIGEKLYKRCYRSYLQEMKEQRDRYQCFLKEKGEPAIFSAWDEKEKEKKGTFAVLETENCYVFYDRSGFLDKDAGRCFEQVFRNNRNCFAAYADQDYVDKDGRRHEPWFKPVWSPDTIFSSFYIGDIFAIRKTCVEERTIRAGETLTEELVQRIFYICYEAHRKEYGISRPFSEKPDVERISKILYHQYHEDIQRELSEYEKQTRHIQDAVLQQAIPVLVLPGEYDTAGSAENDLVSVIIPSKDNPSVLKQCIRSVRKYTKNISYEIHVIDNGSSRSNKEEIEIFCKENQVQYHYHPMPFNFSVMCNLGVSYAAGNYFLFLNDDIEAYSSDWMEKMWKLAHLTHVGAVGAKLLYPNTTLIQHAGVTNLQIGPAHKLMKEDDCYSYYHGRNRGIHDMIAVTAACLMIGRDKFKEAGGFCESIAVSYNDVDFCFSVAEKGYYNVQDNEICLYHHESLSRGNDEISAEKWSRLLKEKELLYARHEHLRGRDPFYSPQLGGNFSQYLCFYEYEYERRTKLYAQTPKICQDPQKYENGCLMLRIEHAQKDRRLEWTEPEDDCIRIEGWSYVLHNDSCRYKRELILKKDTVCYKVKLKNRYRKDVEQILEGESEHTAMAGFYAGISLSGLEKGRYQIGMLAKDKCSRQRLYAMSDQWIEIP